MEAQDNSCRRTDATPKPESTTESTIVSPEKATTKKQTESDSKATECKEGAKEKIKQNRTKKTGKVQKKVKKPKKKIVEPESSDDDSDSDSNASTLSDDSDDDSDASDSDSEVRGKKSKRASKKGSSRQKDKKAAKSKKKKKRRKAKKAQSSDSDSDSDDAEEAASDTEEADNNAETDGSNETDETDESNESEPEGRRQNQQDLQAKLQLQLQQQQLQQQLQQLQQLQLQGLNQSPFLPLQLGLLGGGQTINPLANQAQLLNQGLAAQLGGARGNGRPGGNLPLEDGKKKKKDKGKKSNKSSKNSRLDYKRVDQVWDSSIHNYKLQDTAENSVDPKYKGYIFHIRRTFDWEGKYKSTYVDIKSKVLRDCLQEVMGHIKGVSLVEETPKLDPNILFLYLEDMRAHVKVLKKQKPSGTNKKEKKRDQKRNETKRQHLRTLVKYLDHDYAEVKKSLYPLLENGLITFDMIWALWKPGTLVYTATYGCHDEPRVFKVDMAEKHYSMARGDFYWVEGKYFEYDGKRFGHGSMSIDIPDFQGARKITSLSCYPLNYHKNETELRKTLVERGKKFVQLSGVHYKNHQGMAYFKKKKAVVKVNINGRVMVDPAIHRRINPNYPISIVRPRDHDLSSDDEESDDGEGSCCCESDSEDDSGCRSDGSDSQEEKSKYVTKFVKDKSGNVRAIRVRRDESEDEDAENLDTVQSKDKDAGKGGDSKDGEDSKEEEKPAIPEFSDEEYLIASPVVLGFAFSEKLWLEFTVSGIKEIQWNDSAYDSLVLEPKTKDIVKALVESHKYHAAESIDDVIQGKGKGLVAVLHGPPGTGKTLTAEGISELLKCPLYMASAGELGTDSRYLESELQKILDICHAWGAILLLDEADVFLEKRNMHDIHRNALVSIFLRQLEYFQGILFLTTNRVETFDDAFQSRIHIALRYDSLDQKAKRKIFKIFIERVRVLEKIDLMPFTEEDYTDLAKHDLNGRQIKNTVRTAQALAVNRREPLSMKHIRQVLDVLTSFDRDLKGGTGYQEAMRSYF